MERKQFIYRLPVLTADCDLHSTLKPSALLRYVEQASSEHARVFGMDDTYFKRRHQAFLVAKQAVQVTRMPQRSEQLVLTTACEQFRRGTMKRLTWVSSEAGEPLALVDCRWMLIDTDTGHILRAPVLDDPDFWNDELPGELPLLVHKTPQLTEAGEWTARYSLCDLNGHINNAAYLDLACDALPPEQLRAGRLELGVVKYHREVPLGTAVQLLYAPTEQGWYVVGRRDGHAAFECYLAFAQPAANGRTEE